MGMNLGQRNAFGEKYERGGRNDLRAASHQWIYRVVIPGAPSALQTHIAPSRLVIVTSSIGA